MHPKKAKWVSRFASITAVALVLYALSPGPADCLHDLEMLPDGAYALLIRIYSPLRWFISKLPKPVADAYLWYHTRWSFPPPWVKVIFIGAGTAVAALLILYLVRRINRRKSAPDPP
jgi:hypothetical protein